MNEAKEKKNRRKTNKSLISFLHRSRELEKGYWFYLFLLYRSFLEEKTARQAGDCQPLRPDTAVIGDHGGT